MGFLFKNFSIFLFIFYFFIFFHFFIFYLFYFILLFIFYFSFLYFCIFYFFDDVITHPPHPPRFFILPDPPLQIFSSPTHPSPLFSLPFRRFPKMARTLSDAFRSGVVSSENRVKMSQTNEIIDFLVPSANQYFNMMSSTANQKPGFWRANLN